MSDRNESRKLDKFYAKILVSTRKCVGVFTSTDEQVNSRFFEYVEIDGLNYSYQDKYYIDGAWYEDSAGTIPWSPTT